MNFFNLAFALTLFSIGHFFTSSNASLTNGYHAAHHSVIVNNKINPVAPGSDYPMSKLQEIIRNKQNISALKDIDDSFYILIDQGSHQPIPIEQKGMFIAPLENATALPAEKKIALAPFNTFSFRVYQDIDLVEKLIKMGRIKASDAVAYQKIMLYFIIQTSDQTLYKIYLTNPWPTKEHVATIIGCYNVTQKNHAPTK